MKMYMLMGGMLFAGTVNTIVLKLQDGFSSTVDGVPYNDFNHPFFQCMVMFIGECLCMIVYKI